MEDVRLERLAELRRSRAQPAALLEGADHAHVEEVELRGADRLALDRGLPGRDLERDQRVDQDAEVFLNRGPRDLRVARDLSIVYELPVACRGDLEEPAERRDVPDETFRGDL